MSEAPRGTLIHHYQIDENGLITRANLIIATGHNNYAMDKGVLEVAKQFVHGATLSEGMLNRVEAVIRAFDPVLKLFDPRHRADAAANSACRAGWRDRRGDQAMILIIGYGNPLRSDDALGQRGRAGAPAAAEARRRPGADGLSANA